MSERNRLVVGKEWKCTVARAGAARSGNLCKFRVDDAFCSSRQIPDKCQLELSQYLSHRYLGRCPTLHYARAVGM